jgi:hypothetical protein
MLRMRFYLTRAQLNSGVRPHPQIDVQRRHAATTL